MVRTRLACILAAFICLGLALPARAACELAQLASAELGFNANGGVLVPARIADQDVWMVLQMSSGMAAISPAAVKALDLRTGWVRTDVRIMMNNLPVEREVRIESLMVGGANFSGWTLNVDPGPERPLQHVMGRPVIGTLSARYMNAVDMELDLAAGRMNLFRHARCRGGQVYWSTDYTTETLYADRSGLLFFAMELDGRRVETSLNTLGPRTRLSEEVAGHFFGFKRSEAVRATGPARALGRIVGQQRMQLTARQLSLPELPVHVYDDGERRCEMLRDRPSGAIGFNNCFGFAPFEIGTDVLRRLRIYIASGEQRIYITRNVGPASP